MGKNLQQLNEAALSGHIDLPCGYRRTSYSTNWWKSEYQRKRAELRGKRQTGKSTNLSSSSELARQYETFLFKSYLFIRSATSGWRHSWIPISRIQCVGILIKQFNREITFYSPLRYSSGVEVMSKLSTIKVKKSSWYRKSRGQRGNASSVSKTRQQNREWKHPTANIETYTGRETNGWVRSAAARPPPN